MLHNRRRRGVNAAIIAANAGAFYRHLATNCGGLRGFQCAARTVFHANADLVDGFFTHVFLNRVTRKTTAHRTDDGAQNLAVALTDLVT